MSNATCATGLIAAMLLCANAQLISAEETPRVAFLPNQSFDIQRSLVPGASAIAAVGTIVYSETSRGIKASFLEAKFHFSPLLAANVDVTPDEPLFDATIDGAPWLCTSRALTRDSNYFSFICFADTDQNGEVDRWRRLMAGPREISLGQVQSKLLYPMDPDPIKTPIRLRKGLAEPSDGKECIVEIRYTGLKDGKLAFLATARVGGEPEPPKQSETLVPLSAAGPTTAAILHPFGESELLKLLSQFTSSGELRTREGDAVNPAPINAPALQTARFEVIKADEKSITLTFREPFPAWRHWQSTDKEGKKVEHTAWSGLDRGQ